MEPSGPKIKNFLILFPKNTHLEKISYTFRKNTSHFSAPNSKFFPEKNFLYFFLKNCPEKKF